MNYYVYLTNELCGILISGKFDYDSKLGTCSILEDDQGRSSKPALFVMAFVVPCLVIVICYARIFIVVHKLV